MKYSKELEAIEAALVAYYAKHGGDCTITCSVNAFDENVDVVDEMMWIVGYQPTLKVDNEEIGKIIEAGDFHEYWDI